MKAAIGIIVIISSLVATIGAFASPTIFSGYGYGYGVCEGSAPTGLTTSYSNSHSHIVLSWQAISFSGCSTTEPVSYQVKVRLNDTTVLQSFTDITTLQKSIAAKSLRSNHAYKFQVRAVASDGSYTKWSLYKLFRTIPAKPSQVTVARNTTSAFIQWQNVPRSKNLRYYRVVLQRRNKVIMSKRVTLGLTKPSTGLTVSRLRPHTRYKVLIRAVAPNNVVGEYSKKNFKTL